MISQMKFIPKKKMTPAINAAKKAKIKFTIHQYEHDPKHGSYGMEAAEKLELDPKKVFKTLVTQMDSRELVVAVIPVISQLSMKHIARANKAKKAVMADQTLVQKTTGYVLGGVSPLGQKRKLKTFIDSSAESQQSILVSAGKRGMEIELTPADLAQLTGADFTTLCPK